MSVRCAAQWAQPKYLHTLCLFWRLSAQEHPEPLIWNHWHPNLTFDLSLRARHFLKNAYPIRALCPTDSGTLHRPAQALTRGEVESGDYSDSLANKPGHGLTWHAELSICLQGTPLQEAGEQNEALLPALQSVLPVLLSVRSHNVHLNLKADLFWGWPSAQGSSTGPALYTPPPNKINHCSDGRWSLVYVAHSVLFSESEFSTSNQKGSH